LRTMVMLAHYQEMRPFAVLQVRTARLWFPMWTGSSYTNGPDRWPFLCGHLAGYSRRFRRRKRSSDGAVGITLLEAKAWCRVANMLRARLSPNRDIRDAQCPWITNWHTPRS